MLFYFENCFKIIKINCEQFSECFIKARTGHHLQRENIVKSMNAPSLYGCESLCANEQTFTCNIFSYR